jgi:signal peptidase I
MLLSVLIIGMASMLISCQFHFGALVIASDSMTGEINKGDVILFERYENQTIEEGQVIVFLQSGAKIVHRVVKIENIGGELRYYTKGDANEDIDSGYRTDTDIFALSDVKVSYVGYPTLLLRELLEGSN